ncbi:MAG TPA: CRTAC1 family protein [Candidatus Polarisedimenticolia bacterium]|jgi:hypothetical protein|nr:CRTAC1 family protein [Candidatus Polarisedimenticolia bacterium]
MRIAPDRLPAPAGLALVAGIALIVSACTGASGPAPPAGPQGEGTRKMAERLAQLGRDINLQENPWCNKERAELIRGVLEKSVDPQEYFDLQPDFAEELLKAGKSEEAIQALLDLQKTADSGKRRPTPRNRLFMRHHLAIAYLRLGEQQNCLTRHTTESCILPIKGGGLHGRPEGSTQAIRILMEELNDQPDDLSARWWLNLAAMTLGDYPDKVEERWLIPPGAFESDYDIRRFHDRAPELKLDVNDLAGGSIAEDFDLDGDLDLAVSTVAVDGPIRYFRNNSDGSFTERTAEAGLTGEVWSLNIVQTDYNNDGWPDILMLRGGWLGRGGHLPNSLLKNNGDGTFEDVTEKAGLLSFHPTQTASWLDYDNDGWLDLFIGNESTKRDPNPSELFHNNRDGTFTECAALSGVTVDCFAKGTAAADYNNDGRPDLYVSCREEPNHLYRNDGPKPGGAGPTAWSFTDVTAEAGVAEPIFSFPTWFFDYDNDGWQDLFVSGYQAEGIGDFAAEYLGLPHKAERARLYHNERNGRFKDVTKAAHLYRLLHTMGSNFGDLDNDGWLDFYLGTGDPNLGTLIPNRMFRNAEGRFFQDVTTPGGFGHLQKGHGVSFADFDHDGDQDIYEAMGGVYQGDFYRNVLYENPGHGNHWIKLKLEGVQSNRAALEARIRILADTPEGTREIHRTVTTGGSFGANPLRQEIGLGRATAIREIRVTWPTSGIVQTFKDVGIDGVYSIKEGEEALVPRTLRPFTLGAQPEVASR